MRYISLPGTDLIISQLQLGTADFGIAPEVSSRGIPEEDAFRQLDSFVDSGGNIIDTAIVYSDWLPGQRSRSECTIGKWLQQRKCRDKVYITTKGGLTWEGYDGPGAPAGNLSPALLNRQIQQSLSQIGTDYIDIYWLHRDERSRDAGEIMECLGENVKKGYIRYIGASNWLPDRIVAANAYAEEHGLPAFIGSQIEWSLARMFCPEAPLDELPFMDRETYAFHQSTGLSCFAYSSQAKGFYTKLAALGAEHLPPIQKEHFLNARNLAAFKRIQKLSKETGLSVSQIAIAFISSQDKFAGVPIVASRTWEQFSDTMTAADVHLTPEQVHDLLCEE